MTKRKKTLMDLLIESVTPEAWDESLKFAVFGKNSKLCYASRSEPFFSDGYWYISGWAKHNKKLFSSDEIPKFWNKTIITREEFIKAYNEKNGIGKVDHEFPDKSRIDQIGQNGGDGEHYDAVKWGSVENTIANLKSKYHRQIKPGVFVDVYDVLNAWGVQNPALQHLIKKALQPGERGHKDLQTDLNDIIASAKRAKELAGFVD